MEFKYSISQIVTYKLWRHIYPHSQLISDWRCKFDGCSCVPAGEWTTLLNTIKWKGKLQKYVFTFLSFLFLPDVDFYQALSFEYKMHYLQNININAVL